MALAKNTNSYVTVAEADAYFADLFDVSAWEDAESSVKAKALVSATSLLDQQKWIGNAVDEAQLLAFPRSGMYFDPRIGASISLPADTPPRILKATHELALHLLLNESLQAETGTVDSLNVGSISLTKIQAPPKIPFKVMALISPMLQNGGARLWWRAN